MKKTFENDDDQINDKNADYNDNDRINDRNADYNADDATAGFALPQLDEAGASEHGLASRPPQVSLFVSLWTSMKLLNPISRKIRNTKNTKPGSRQRRAQSTKPSATSANRTQS